MIAQKQTPESKASSERRMRAESVDADVASDRKFPSRDNRDNDGLDLARFSPQQIASELARRSQSVRSPGVNLKDNHAGDAPATAGQPAESVGDRNEAEDAAPFDRLSQALSPGQEERRRLKQQYIEERYRWEEVHEHREKQLGRSEPGDVNGPGSTADMPRAEPTFSSFAADSRLVARHASAPHDMDVAAFPDRPQVSGPAIADISAEPRLTSRNTEDLRAALRAPDDVRSLITTSFERPVRSTAGGRHGVLLLFAAIAIGAALYFHPWSLDGGAGRSDMPPAKTASDPVHATPTDHATATASAPSAVVPKVISSTAPQAAPAASMTPMSAETAPAPASASASSVQPASPVAPQNTAATRQATGTGSGNPSASISQPGEHAVDAAASRTPGQGPKQSFAPAGMTAASRDAAQRVSASQETARPVGDKPQAVKGAGQTSRPSLEIKPSSAWLHVQPYSGGDGNAAAPAAGDDTPDAWMKPQPYRAPGVLTPPN